MAKRILQIVEVAYRATLEEQDDTVIWLTHMMRANGGDADVLLQGHSVNYAIGGQDASGLQIGAWRQKCPPQLAEDIASLVTKGAAVHLLSQDLKARGLQERDLIPGLKLVSRADLPRLFERYDQVWHW